MIEFTSSGSFKNTEAFLFKMKNSDIFKSLEPFGQRGVDALARTTPRKTGKTANSWTYEIKKGFGYWQISWSNSNYAGNKPLAIMLQVGHGVPGGYVAGKDYINPAIKPIFDQIVEEAWKVVTSA